MLRVAEHFEQTSAGRAGRANEDALFARSPLFVVADGMGGARAGEVASRLAVDAFRRGLPAGDGTIEQRLAARVCEANDAIHALSQRDADRAGMGTTIVAACVGEEDVTIAHVGDSRAYRWRDGVLERLTEDHSLVAELLRHGEIAEEQAHGDPRRSIITRALGSAGDVQVDTRTVPAVHGDVFLLCSDGLTSMIAEDEVARILAGTSDLGASVRSLVRAANDEGGRDNITVALFRLEEFHGAPARQPVSPTTEVGDTIVSEPSDATGSVSPTQPTQPTQPTAGMVSEPARELPHVPSAMSVEPPRSGGEARRRRRRRLAGGSLVALVIFAGVMMALSAAVNSVYFIGTDDQGRVALFRGLPYDLPLGIGLYRKAYTSGIAAAALSPQQRERLLDQQSRSRDDAANVLRKLEQDRIAP